MNNDKDLIARIANSDKSAMKTLYERHNRALLAFLISKGTDHATASDVLHDAMLEVWRSAAKFNGKSAVKTWVYTIARNKLVDRFRKSSRLSFTDDVPETQDDAPDPEACALAAGEASRVRACLEELKPSHQTVIRLAFYDDMNYQEISEVEDVPVGTIKTRIFHAKKMLMRCLGAA